jgi:hypothetical protein
MPKASSPPSSYSKASSEDPSYRMSDVALRKKKNADAQAAFRARRANYIATLEETGQEIPLGTSMTKFLPLTVHSLVTSLESVVLQLQDSCREAKTEANEMRQENSRIRHDFREREKLWKALFQTRKTGRGPESDDLPPTPPSFSPTHSQSSSVNSHLASSHMSHYGNDTLVYRTGDDPSGSLQHGSYNSGPSHAYPSHSPSLSFTGVESDQLSDSPTHTMNSQSAAKYGPYPYPISGPTRSASWPSNLTHSAPSGPESCPPTSNGASHSPSFVESPSLTPPSYLSRFPVDDQKVSLSSIDTAPYAFPTSRSISPTTTAPGSSSSTPAIPSAFPYTFAESSLPHDHSDYDYRRPHGGEVTLHGGTADISMVSSNSDVVRYRLGAQRRSDPVGDRRLFPALAVLSGSDNGSHHDRGSSEGEGTPHGHSTRLRPRRGVAAPRLSHSPSPEGPPISGTLAVIKAQAFGALRRTRSTRNKKSSERDAAKVAMDALSARGIGMGVDTPTGSKRQRLHNRGSDMP